MKRLRTLSSKRYSTIESCIPSLTLGMGALAATRSSRLRRDNLRAKRGGESHSEVAAAYQVKLVAPRIAMQKQAPANRRLVATTRLMDDAQSRPRR